MMDNIKKGMIMARAELFECLNPTENLWIEDTGGNEPTHLYSTRMQVSDR
jgi:hypothetical protein